MQKIPKILRKSPFTYRQAMDQGLTQGALQSLVESGDLEHVSRGIYRATDQDYNEENQYRTATLLMGAPSAICLISALAHYGVTDLIPKKTWIMVPHTKRSQHRELKLQRSRSPEWNIGIESRQGYSITSLERTIVEALCYRNKIGTSVAVDALRKAVSSKKTSLSKIMAMAKQMSVLHRVIPYIETLA